jgi:subtilisin family serine protease
MHHRTLRALKRTLLALLAVLASSPGVSFAASPSEEETELLIVRAQGGQLQSLAARNQLTILEQVEGEDGDEVALVSVKASGPPENAAAALVARESAIRNAEPAGKARLPELVPAAALEQSTDAVVDALAAEGSADLGSEPDGSVRELWSGYVEQPAARLVHLSEAQRQGWGAGAVIAVIDSAIDPLHPVLAGRLVPGWDFLQETASTSSLRATVDQSTMAILDQSTMAILDARTRAVLRGAGDVEAIAVDDSTAALFAAGVGAGIEGRIGPAFGHGTMVAGIVHLVAPDARIMPLRAFNADGYASTFDLIQAIRYATLNGATVINLSFSLESESMELERAIEFATRRGVICVPAAGNDGVRALVYPAALPDTIGVAATDLDDFVAAFSNFGNELVTLAAPGVSIVTTYPGGGWAAGSGTSFATPWISGAVALLAERAARGGVGLDLDRALHALSHGAPVRGSLASEVGFGRLDVEQAGANLSLAPAIDGGPGNGGNGSSGSGDPGPGNR